MQKSNLKVNSFDHNSKGITPILKNKKQWIWSEIYFLSFEIWQPSLSSSSSSFTLSSSLLSSLLSLQPLYSLRFLWRMFFIYHSMTVYLFLFSSSFSYSFTDFSIFTYSDLLWSPRAILRSTWHGIQPSPSVRNDAAKYSSLFLKNNRSDSKFSCCYHY